MLKKCIKNTSSALIENLTKARDLVEDAFSTFKVFTAKQTRMIYRQVQQLLEISHPSTLLSAIGYERDFLGEKLSCDICFCLLDDLSLWIEKEMKELEVAFHYVFPPYDEDRIPPQYCD